MTGKRLYTWNIRCGNALRGWGGGGPTLTTIRRDHPDLWDVLTSLRDDGLDPHEVGHLIAAEFDAEVKS